MYVPVRRSLVTVGVNEQRGQKSDDTGVDRSFESKPESCCIVDRE